MVGLPSFANTSSRVGSHRGMFIAIALLALGLLPFWWLTTLPWALIAGIVLGAGLAGFLSLSDVLLAEVIDADARKLGPRREGSFFGINGFAVRFGITLEAGVRSGAARSLMRPLARAQRTLQSTANNPRCPIWQSQGPWPTNQSVHRKSAERRPQS